MSERIMAPRHKAADQERHHLAFRQSGREHPFSVPSGSLLQAKLTVSQPADPCEQEAERVADAVMTMRLPEPTSSAGGQNAGEETAVRQEEVDRLVQRRAGVPTVEEAPPIVSEVLESGGGVPLHREVRAFMEPRFGHDFSQVRVHTDARAAGSAAAIQARAYTVGRDVVFGEGEYTPETREGQRLLAHELAHVVQQGSAPAHIPESEGMVQSKSLGTASDERVQRQGGPAEAAVGVAGLVLSGVSIVQAHINQTGVGLSYSSDMITYPRSVEQIPPDIKEVVMPVAEFNSFGMITDNRTKFNLHGHFGAMTDDQGRTTPVLANVYIDLAETTTYYASSLGFKATALQTAFGTPEDPKVRFVCTGRFDPAGPGDCTYRVVLEVDRWGSVKCIDKAIINGSGNLVGHETMGFTLTV